VDLIAAATGVLFCIRALMAPNAAKIISNKGEGSGTAGELPRPAPAPPEANAFRQIT
jgi:hypothetical protein